MPKVTGTRKQRAAELLERLENGPSFGGPDLNKDAAAIATKNYQLWAQTWVINQLHELIPELRAMKQAKANQ